MKRNRNIKAIKKIILKIRYSKKERKRENMLPKKLHMKLKSLIEMKKFTL